MRSWKVRLRGAAKGAVRLLTRCLPLRAVRAIFEVAVEELHRRGPDFVTTRLRPKTGSAVGPYRVFDPVARPVGRTAIVLQGPILREENFTVESVRYYRANCPEWVIIVSTWEGEDGAALAALRAAGAEVVLNPKPAVPGRFNVNFQAASTRGGVRRAAELGCAYVAKTRADQRVYALAAVLSLPWILDAYPVRNAPTQSKRLVSTSYITSKYAPYFFSDLFMFGTPADMLDYWSPPDDDVQKGRDELMAEKERADTFEGHVAVAPEFHLLRAYLSRGGDQPPFRVADWWQVLADRLCVVDWSSLDVYWPKYLPHDERHDLSNDAHPVGHQVRFLDWLALYSAAPGRVAPPDESVLAASPRHPLPPRPPRGPAPDLFPGARA